MILFSHMRLQYVNPDMFKPGKYLYRFSGSVWTICCAVKATISWKPITNISGLPCINNRFRRKWTANILVHVCSKVRKITAQPLIKVLPSRANNQGNNNSDGDYDCSSGFIYETYEKMRTLPFRFHVPTYIVHCLLLEYSADLVNFLDHGYARRIFCFDTDSQASLAHNHVLDHRSLLEFDCLSCPGNRIHFCQLMPNTGQGVSKTPRVRTKNMSIATCFALSWKLLM